MDLNATSSPSGIRVFFYGLFMDATLLKSMGFHPAVIGPAELSDYQIRIGDRATLTTKRGSKSYGIVMELAEGEVAALYAKPGVLDYQAEDVDVVLLSNGSTLTATCYNLPLSQLKSIVNTDYADRLAALVLALGFSPAYAGEISERQ